MLLFLLLGGLLPAAFVLAGPERGPPTDSRAAWLRDHALRIRTIDPGDDGLGDLEPLRKLLRGVRIVGLGEETHGDGACFRAKTRLVRFLHEELGFDVLAFESGLYGCERFREQLLDGAPGRAAAEEGLFSVWTRSAQMQPLFAYLAERAKTDRPLEPCGFDVQLTGEPSRDLLPLELRDHLKAAAPEHRESEVGKRARAAVEWLTRGGAATEEERTRHREALFDLGGALAAARERGRVPAVKRAFWIQLLESLSALVEVRHGFRVRGSGDVAANDARDAQMARNLLWLARERYPERKIVVWAHNAHLLRRKGRLDGPRQTLSDPMGRRLAESFGSRYYALGFTAYGGAHGRPYYREPMLLENAPPGSFEALCAEAGLEHALVDLRAPPAGGDWLREAFPARPLHYVTRTVDWADRLDGLFFQRRMTPSD